MIDWGRIDELRDEVGEEDLIEVIELFCEEVAEVMDKLSTAETKELPGQIHFLKGSAQNIGIRNLADLCMAIESEICSDPAYVPNTSILQDAFASARRALSEQIDLN